MSLFGDLDSPALFDLSGPKSMDLDDFHNLRVELGVPIWGSRSGVLRFPKSRISNPRSRGQDSPEIPESVDLAFSPKSGPGAGWPEGGDLGSSGWRSGVLRFPESVLSNSRFWPKGILLGWRFFEKSEGFWKGQFKIAFSNVFSGKLCSNILLNLGSGSL